MARGTPWQRDELVLALDLYFRMGAQVSARDPEVIALSEVLYTLPADKLTAVRGSQRSPESVRAKLQNFLTIDPAYHGKGLSHGSRGDREVWKEFADRREHLSAVARAIRESARGLEEVPRYEEEGEEEFPEGRLLYRLHRQRERDPGLVRKAKDIWLQKYGRLVCSVCGFDFAKVYGSLGDGYIECHHIRPVSELRSDSKTRVRDLAPVCANCHRMLHRKRPCVSMEELSTLIDDP